jgi:hypothetical protein
MDCIEGEKEKRDGQQEKREGEKVKEEEEHTIMLSIFWMPSQWRTSGMRTWKRMSGRGRMEEERRRGEKKVSTYSYNLRTVSFQREGRKDSCWGREEWEGGRRKHTLDTSDVFGTAEVISRIVSSALASIVDEVLGDLTECTTFLADWFGIFIVQKSQSLSRERGEREGKRAWATFSLCRTQQYLALSQKQRTFQELLFRRTLLVAPSSVRAHASGKWRIHWCQARWARPGMFWERGGGLCVAWRSE